MSTTKAHVSRENDNVLFLCKLEDVAVRFCFQMSISDLDDFITLIP